jgi:hypothetical protein
MSAVQRIALAFLLFGLQVAAALADGPPKLDVTRTCNGAAQATGRAKEACLEDEQVGQSMLAKKWSKYRADAKARCIAIVQIGGVPSYVELLSCLDTMQDAKGVRDGDGIMVEADPKQLTSRPAGEWGTDGLPLSEEPPPLDRERASPARPCPDAPAAFAALPPTLAGWLCSGMRP